jgi:hypothetical protein
MYNQKDVFAMYVWRASSLVARKGEVTCLARPVLVRAPLERTLDYPLVGLMQSSDKILEISGT